jgi:regulator of protease activity HflC (stomatin/prohibitin superfamily)
MNEEDLIPPEKPKRKRTVKPKVPVEPTTTADAMLNVNTPTISQNKTPQKGNTNMNNMSITKLLGIAAAAILAIALLISLPRLVENVDTTEFKIKQAAVTGTMSCHNEPGWFLQNLGSVVTYDKTGTIYFSEENLDGGESEDADPLPATFQGNSTGKVSGYLKYRLPRRCEDQLILNSEYKNQETVRMDLVRNAISTAITQTGPLFTAEEANIDRRPEFTKLVREILEQGEFLTSTSEIMRIEDGDSANAQRYKVTKMYLDSNGNRVISKPSVLKRYGIEVIALDIKRITFDQKTKELMDAKKTAEQQRIASKAIAERSKQDAITEKAQGEARTAKAKADQEVIKITEVTQAEKQFEVARLAAATALEEAKKVKAAGEAEAYANKLKVQAGLTPLERATIEKDTKIGIAQALAGVKFPEQMIISGGGNGGGANPFEAVGLKALYNLSDEMSKNKQ